MNAQPLVSVIVPVYNKEKYLKKCIDSIINQTYSNLEIILINDGSKDSSLEICYTYEKKDRRIKVIDQKNAGPSVARNKGIENASGEYISFVDADDEIELNTYEILVHNILDAKAQMALIGMRYIFKDKTQDVQRTVNEKSILNKKQMLDLFFSDIIMCFSSVNKLYSRSLIGDTRFDVNIKMSEDQKFIYGLLQKVDYVIYDPTICYNINYTDKSLSRATPTRYHLAQLDVNEYILNQIDDIEIRKKAIIYNIDLCLTVFVPNYLNGDFTQEDIKRINKIVRSNWKVVLFSGNKTQKIKMLLYLISPKLLTFVLEEKRKRDDNTV